MSSTSERFSPPSPFRSRGAGGVRSITLALSLVLACSSPSGQTGAKTGDTGAKSGDPESEPKPEAPGEPVQLTLWHTYRDVEQKALEAVVADWNASPEGKRAPVRLEANPYDGFSDKLTAAIPRGNGPDLFIFAHDRIGGWAKSQIVAPLQDYVDEATIGGFWPETLPPLEFQEQLYGLPLAYKSAVLYYNTELVKEPPKDTAALIELAKGLTQAKDGVFGLVYPHSVLFHHSPWLFGFGGKLLEGTKPTLDTPENARSLEFAKGLVDAGIIPKEVDPSLLASLFNSRKAAMVVNGPWFRGEIAPDVKYAVAPIPQITESGKPASPFLSVEAVLISEKSAHKKEAYAFASYLASEGSLRRLREGKQSVAAKAAYALTEAKDDPILQVFLAQLHASTPTPNIPEMNAIWSPFDRALEAVISGRSDAASALKEAQAKAEGK
jgi:maltose-binding protein MalE